MPSHLLNDSLSIRDNHLYIEGCDTVSLAQNFGTPLFVVSETRLRQNFRRLRRAFSACWPEGPVEVLPSIKASPLIAIQKILTSEGAGADVFGPGELEIALRAGVPAQSISVNGSIKDYSIVRRSVEIGAKIVLDSSRELDLCEEVSRELRRPAQVVFRLKPYLDDIDLQSDYAPVHDIRTLIQIIKYGIPTSDLLDIGRRALLSPHIEPVGIHMHMGRHSKRLDVWQSWVRHGVLLTKELSDAMSGWVPKSINIGGGLPSLPDLDTDVTVKGYPGPTLEEMAQAITDTLRETLQRANLPAAGMALQIEPGRAIHCDTGVHLTTVRNIKHETRHVDREWIEVDTSQMFLGIGGANFDGPKFDFLTASRADEPASRRVDIVGQTCNLELLFHQVMVPPLEVGDVIALLNTGSYIESCGRNFNALPRPGTVLVHRDVAEMIKRHEHIDEVLERDVVPLRLGEQAARL